MKRQSVYLLFFCLAIFTGFRAFGVLDCLIALDTGGVVTEKLGFNTGGAVFDAHKGIVEVISYRTSSSLI